MKIILVIAVMLCFGLQAFGQSTRAVETQPSDEIMSQVVGRILTFYFKPKSKPVEYQIYNLNIKPEWLPKIRNVHFLLIEDKPELADQKGYFFKRVEKSGDQYLIDFGYGEPHCNATGDTWAFKMSDGNILIGRDPSATHWGMGCGSSSGSGDSTRQ